MQRVITVICVALMVVGMAGGSMANPASDALVAEGRGLLFNNGEPAYSGVIAANDKFVAANTADDEDQTAMLFLAVTKLALFGLENGDSPTLLQTFRDLYEAFGISRTDTESLLETPISEPPTVFDEYDPPDTLPDGDEVQNFLAGPFLLLINEVTEYVDGVNNTAITINITPDELGDTTGVEVDYGDVLLLRSFLYTLKAFILLMDSYDMDALDIQELAVLINADVLQLQRDIFDPITGYANFLKLNTSDSLAASREALLTAIATAHDAYDFIVDESPDPQEDDLFAFGSEEDKEEAENLLAMMAAFKTSLDDNQSMEFETRDVEWVLTNTDNGTKLGFRVEIEDGEAGEGEAWGIDTCDFLFCNGGVNEYSIEGDQLTIELETYQWCGDHEEILRATLVGTLNETHDQIISGTYSKPGCSGESTGPFSFTGELIGEETEVVKMDFNRIYGNTGKSPVNIHDVLPEFDVYDESIPGSFSEPVLGGFFPDVSTNDNASMFFELQPSGAFEIPNRSVTFSGKIDDWLSNELLHDDIEGDHDTDIIGTDIEKVYLAKDDTYLYVGMILHDGAPDQAVRYELGFRNSADDGYMPVKMFAVNDSGTWRAGLEHWNNDVSSVDGSVSTGANCIEWRILLSEITSRLDNGSLSGKFVSTATLSPQDEEDYDFNQTRIQLDPVTLTGSFTCPAHEGSGKIFIKVMGEADRNSDWELGSTWVAGSTGGTYIINGLPADQDVYVYAFWDKDGNGIVTYPDYWWGTPDDLPVSIQAGTNSLDIYITGTVINSVGPFVVTGSVMSVHQPNDSIETYYSVYLGNFILGELPDGITDIIVKDPNGSILLDKDEFDYDGGGGSGEFFMTIEGEPLLGTYTFSVTAGGLTVTATDVQDATVTVPVPDIGTFEPAVGTIVGSMTPVFSWDAVDFDNAFYRLEINDQYGNRVYATSRVPGMLSVVVPKGILQTGQTYYWRIRVTDADNWVDVQNRSNSEWIEFTMADTLNHDAMPALDLDGWGVVVYSGGDTTVDWINLDTYVKVIDHDGIAPDGSSHTVTLEFPDGRIENLPHDYSESPTTAYFGCGFDIAPQSGDYIFRVVDPGNNSGEITDNLPEQFTVTPLAPPQALAPAMDSVVADTCPTFQWDAVDRANRYRVRIYNMDGGTVMRGNPPNATEWTVPPGILAPHTQYKYRVEARDAHISFETDSSTRYPASSADYIRFTTGSQTEAPFIDFANSGVDTWNSDVTDPFLSFWIKVHDAQGIPGNIKSVKVQFPDTSEQDLYYEYNESSTCGIYRADFFPAGGEIQSGEYTYVAEDMDGNAFSLVETPSFAPIGFPAAGSLVQSSDEDGVHFTWDSVDGAAFYRVDIYDQDYKRVHALATETNEYHLAPGYLEDGKLYSWRVTTWREFFDENVDNGSSSPYFSSDRQNFIMSPDTGGSALPEVDTAGWGVYLMQANDPSTGANGYCLAFKAKVSDADGVPGNIKEVTVTYPDGSTTRTLVFDSDISGTAANYYKDEIVSSLAGVQAGTYTFSVTDFDGNISVVVSDTLTIDPIAVPQNCLPAQGSVINIFHPQISWDTVPGATRYKVKLLTGFMQTIYDSDFITENTYIVPDDVLNVGTGYSYRVYAYREDPAVDVDNASVTNFFWSQNTRFTATGFGDANANGDVDLGDVILIMQSVVGMTSSDISIWGDANGDGKIGLAEAIYDMQKEAELR